MSSPDELHGTQPIFTAGCQRRRYPAGGVSEYSRSGSLSDVLVGGGRWCRGWPVFGAVGAAVHGYVVGVVDEPVEDGFSDDGVGE